jgi:hypothetical protein
MKEVSNSVRYVTRFGRLQKTSSAVSGSEIGIKWRTEHVNRMEQTSNATEFWKRKALENDHLRGLPKMGSWQLAGFSINGIDSSGFVTKKLVKLTACTKKSNWVYNWIFYVVAQIWYVSLLGTKCCLRQPYIESNSLRFTRDGCFSALCPTKQIELLTRRDCTGHAKQQLRQDKYRNNVIRQVRLRSGRNADRVNRETCELFQHINLLFAKEKLFQNDIMSTNYCGSYEHVQTARLLCLLYVSERTISRTYAAEADYGRFRDRKTGKANSVSQSWNNYRYWLNMHYSQSTYREQLKNECRSFKYS